ncbi:MAG: sulfite exporter TauE/SafE family protein [Deltaproteobacteria bacterium]|nr:MAG: sulfite exporter TauE/SafE family protein [Deltaproteobacteria bacterium]
MELGLAAFIGCIAGLIMGTIGIGGGAIIIFSLLYILHFPQKLAQGTTLFVVAAPLSLLAAFTYYRHGYVNLKVGLIMMLFFLGFSWLGAYLGIRMPKETLRQLLGVGMVLMGLKVLLG